MPGKMTISVVEDDDDLEAGYQAMTADEEYEMEAQEWCHALVRDFID